MILLDLCCHQGGAAVGYARAGFTVYGVDIEYQRRYPFPFLLADVIDVLTRLLAGEPIAFSDGTRLYLADIDVIHVSPPCQGYSITRHTHGVVHRRMVHQVRLLLMQTGKAYVIENVEGTPMVRPILLCGSEFDLTAKDADGTPLRLERHRLFESNIPLKRAGTCQHDRTVQVGGAYGGGSRSKYHAHHVRGGGYTPSKAVRSELLGGVEWMTMTGQAQCVPPAYTEHLGKQLMEAVR